MFYSFYQWLLPAICILCAQPTHRQQDLCYPCLQDLPILPQSCPVCANYFTSSDPLACGTCLALSPPFAKTYALFAYQPPITQLITELKFQERLVHAKVLGELLAENLNRRWYACHPLPEMIIPMPLHKDRLKERGFNQAIEIARPISKKLAIPINKSAQRIKATTAQTLLPGNARLNNVKNAFAINQNLTGRHIAVLDDVITTGNTITALCKVLKKHGAAQIDVWCVAKVIKNE